jgi:hypothetical protein
MTEGAVERLRLGNDLRGALARGELAVQFQPLVRITDGCMLGAEVLMRWNHPKFGAVAPSHFIPIAEELGLISEYGTWVLRVACQQLAEWDRADFADAQQTPPDVTLRQPPGRALIQTRRGAAMQLIDDRFECKEGPFTPTAEFDFARWAPAEGDAAAGDCVRWMLRAEPGERFSD